jgi:hypothetical protein
VNTHLAHIPEGYKLTYQGGWHNVYCNGVMHITTTGGYTDILEPTLKVLADYKCNCSQFNALRNNKKDTSK